MENKRPLLLFYTLVLLVPGSVCLFVLLSSKTRKNNVLLARTSAHDVHGILRIMSRCASAHYIHSILRIMSRRASSSFSSHLLGEPCCRKLRLTSNMATPLAARALPFTEITEATMDLPCIAVRNVRAALAKPQASRGTRIKINRDGLSYNRTVGRMNDHDRVSQG